MTTALKFLLFGAASPAAAYSARVLATNPIRYNKLNEASGTAIVDSSSNGYTGTYTGVDLANTDSPFLPNKAPLWDGTNDYGDLYSASFASAFSLDEVTISIWFKVASSTVWTDSALRRFFAFVRNSTNFIRASKSATNNTITVERTANSTAKSITIGSQNSTAWNCLQVSCSVLGGGLLAAGEMRAYINGTEVGTAATANVASVGSGLASAQALLGARIIPPDTVWNGWLASCAIWARPIDAGILALATA